jgi:hypothetical protein
MQTRVFQLKLRTLNRGKAQRLAVMQQAFTDAVRLHLDTAYALPKPSVNSLHAICYHEARQRFPLPAATVQQARDKALAIYRSVRTRQRQGKHTSRPRLQRLLPLRLAVETLRLFVWIKVWRASPRLKASYECPSSFLRPGVPCVPCHMPCLNSSAVVQTGT